MTMRAAGHPLGEIRQRLDEKYRGGTSTPTPQPPGEPGR
ncbi:MAG: hypothetical protein DMD81_03335 [Candidatus Rokuibacteriota bacterium]|nr:MAG: hypothetical protein DMD81_03335 [Candidatus Rokubacteria bacterium]